MQKYDDKTIIYKKYDKFEIRPDCALYIRKCDFFSRQVDAHQNISAIIAETTTENVDATRVARVLGNADPQTD